jgi:hypothetical protein
MTAKRGLPPPTRRAVRRPFLGTSTVHRQWLCTAKEGLVCSTVGAVLHVFCYSATTKLLLRPFIPGGCPVLFVEQTGGAWLHWLLYTMAFDLSLICQVRCMLSNPGAVPKDALPLPEDEAAQTEAGTAAKWLKERYCRKCQAFKPARAVMLRICPTP